MPEVLNLSTRILVFREGRIAGELAPRRGVAGSGHAAHGRGRGVKVPHYRAVS